MNIIHVIPGDLWAGAEAQVYYTVQEIYNSSKHEVKVILFSEGELYKRLLAVGVDVTLLDEETLSSIAIYNGIRRILTECDVHIIHVHEYKSHILAALAKLTVRNNKSILFRTQHGQNLSSSFKSWLILGFEKVFLRYLTDHLIAVSEELKNILLQKSSRAKIHLIHNAVPLNALPSPPNIGNIRRSYGLENKTFWIGTVARLEMVKNIQMLIAAAKQLKDKYPNMNFRISVFGEGSLREVYREQIIQYRLEDHFFLEGHNNNILPVLQAFDVFTLTSLHEGLPMSLLEAMSVGTIPVCTSVGGMKEVISHGVDGFLVPPNDAGELANILVRVHGMVENMEFISINAIDKIRKSYSIEKNCQRLITFYETFN